jgi:hypothetical protein
MALAHCSEIPFSPGKRSGGLMATILLSAAGAAIGGSILGPVGAMLGRAAGAYAGSLVDQRMFGRDQVIRAPRLDEARIMASMDGAPMPRAYGRVRLGGQVIWATRFEAVTKRRKQGGKGGPSVTTETTAYLGNFAIGLCEGPVHAINRIWADGVEIDRTRFEIRTYLGTEDQPTDPLIAAKQGGGRAPAFRGTVVAVFEGYPLEKHGNRIPQFSFEVVRSIARLDRETRAVTIIPGATEFGLDPAPAVEDRAGSPSVNRHVTTHLSDWAASIDELQRLCPRLETVALVVAWFGGDLRAGNCRVEPCVEHLDSGPAWTVSGISRRSAREVSRFEGKPAYGGTPSDSSVVAAIADLKRRGLKVMLYPFVMMDVPAENALPDPYGQPGQEAYPWRGRITCHPAPGMPATADRTASARSQASAFAGTIHADAFRRKNGAVECSSSELSYRRMVLHYAHLAMLAGGVDGFLIGSEMRGLTTVRDQAGAHPFVEQLMVLAAEVRAILGPATKLTYAADWTEYFGCQPADAPGDRLFHLDPLWAHPSIDAVGIDNYMPLSDWRIGSDPGDATARTACDPDYLARNVTGGEGFDWYYANTADRAAGRRTPITDGRGEPWIWRYKDLVAWWSNQHHERTAGVRNGIATAWQPRSKPIWFTELGCPAVALGPNQPNVFPDRKSAAAGLPYGSSGARSDIAQSRFIRAHFEHWANPANNPHSPLYGGPMVDIGRIFLWAWDARPFPEFPARGATWADGVNWHAGHWLNGRIGGCPADELLVAVAADFGVAATASCDGFVDGYAMTGPMPARAALEPLAELFGLGAADDGDAIRFAAAAYSARAEIDAGDIVEEEERPSIRLERDQETELPREIGLSHADLMSGYETGQSYSRRLETGSRRTVSMQLPVVLPRSTATGLLEARLRAAWVGRDRMALSLPLRHASLSPGDTVSFGERIAGRWRIEAIEDGASRRLSLRSESLLPEEPGAQMPEGAAAEYPVAFGRPRFMLMNLPTPSDQAGVAVHAAIEAEPWAGSYAIWSSPGEAGFQPRLTTQRRATTGTLIEPVGPGPEGRFDMANRIRVRLHQGVLSGEPDALIFNGANAAAVRSLSGDWELLQFSSAVLEADGSWTLTRLLRAQQGTDAAMVAGTAAGAAFVLLDDGVETIMLETFEKGLTLNWRAGPADDAPSSQSFEAVTHTHSPVGQRPFSPAALRANRLAGGDIALAWTRRSRISGDDWEAAEIPLDEAVERFRVEIIGAAEVRLRTVETNRPSWRYGAAEQSADYANLPGSITFAVAQVGASGLPGTWRRATIAL